MDTFVDSSWYQYRYLWPHYDERAVRPATCVERGCPSTQYTGGIEHAIMHLMYFRFFTKAMRDIGLVRRASRSGGCSTRASSWARTARRCRRAAATSQDPDELVDRYGADTRPAVPDVHRPVGPGRPVEPDRHHRREQVPASRVGVRDRSRTAPTRATGPARTCPRGRPSTTRDRACGPRRTGRCAT